MKRNSKNRISYIRRWFGQQQSYIVANYLTQYPFPDNIYSPSFANEITSVDEAKKYYSLFGLMANVALIFSGQYVKYVSNLRVGLPPGKTEMVVFSSTILSAS